MKQPCCVGVVRDKSKLKGVDLYLAGSHPYHTADELSKQIYVSNASDHGISSNGVGCIVIHDIFGFDIPNCKYVADHLASKGYNTVMPNFFRTVGSWPATETDILEPLEGDAFGNWFGAITSEAFWAEQFLPTIRSASRLLKESGCDQLVLVGFCWGGKAMTVAAKTGIFSAGTTTRISLVITNGHHNPSIVHVVLAVESSHAEVQAAGAEVQVFEGLYHGFVARGDFANDAATKAAADKAMNNVVGFFDRVPRSADDLRAPLLREFETAPHTQRVFNDAWGKALAQEPQSFYPPYEVNHAPPQQPSYIAHIPLDTRSATVKMPMQLGEQPGDGKCASPSNWCNGVMPSKQTVVAGTFNVVSHPPHN